MPKLCIYVGWNTPISFIITLVFILHTVKFVIILAFYYYYCCCCCCCFLFDKNFIFYLLTNFLRFYWLKFRALFYFEALGNYLIYLVGWVDATLKSLILFQLPTYVVTCISSDQKKTMNCQPTMFPISLTSC